MHISSEGIAISELTTCAEEPRWLAAAQHGEPQALEWIFQTYHRSIYSLCYRLLGRTADAEDATQTTFISAFRRLSDFRGQSSIKTWLYRIAVNESLTLLRHRRRSPCQLDEELGVGDGAAEIVEKAAIAATIARMRPEQRLILVLFYWEDLSCEEIAAISEISLSAAKMRLKRAREEFQRNYGSEL